MHDCAALWRQADVPAGVVTVGILNRLSNSLSLVEMLLHAQPWIPARSRLHKYRRQINTDASALQTCRLSLFELRNTYISSSSAYNLASIVARSTENTPAHSCANNI